ETRPHVFQQSLLGESRRQRRRAQTRSGTAAAGRLHAGHGRKISRAQDHRHGREKSPVSAAYLILASLMMSVLTSLSTTGMPVVTRPMMAGLPSSPGSATLMMYS